VQQACSNPGRVHELLLAAGITSIERILGLTRNYRDFVEECPGLNAATVGSYGLSNSHVLQLAQAEGQAF